MRSSAAAVPELHRLLPAARHARPRPGGADPRRRPAGARPEQSRRADGEGRAGDPALPAVPRRGAALDGAGLRPSRPLDPLWNAENWWLASGASGGARRLAPRRPGRGRRGRADAAARRHGRVRPPAGPSRLSQLLRVQALPARRPATSAARSCDRRSSRSRPRLRPKLVSRVDFTTRPPFTLTYHIRPEARWSDGVPVTAGTSSSPQAILEAPRCRRLPAPRPQRPRAGREDGQGRPPLPLRLLARSVRSCCRGTRSRARTSTTIWTGPDRQPEDGRPIGSGPFLVELVSAAAS